MQSSNLHLKNKKECIYIWFFRVNCSVQIFQDLILFTGSGGSWF